MNNHSEKHCEVVRSIMRSYPQVREGRMFGYPAFFVGRRMFACVYGDGVGVKLPRDVSLSLLVKPGIIPFQPHGKHKMREWIQINRKRSTDYRNDIPIFELSIHFVANN